MNDVTLLNLAPHPWLRGMGYGDRTEGEMRELGGHGTNLHLDSPASCPVVPTALPGPKTTLPHPPPSSVLLLGSAVLRNALGSQFSQHVIQIIGIWVAMTCEIRAELRLVVDLIPDDRI